MRRSRKSAAMWGLVAGLGAMVAGASDGPDGPPTAPIERFDEEQLGHWAYQTPVRVAPPDVKEGSRVRNPIDRFILAGLEEMDFVPSPEADRVSLIRRVTFDLTGLPPTAEEVNAFLADEAPDAFERLVDRLLASPAYGERWAQHWLDLAHYADSNGFELDADRPDAWRYRDWVVKSLNDDLPYDRFVTLQIAGDEVAPGDSEALIATGFGRCGPREVVAGNIDPRERRQSELTEVTGTVGSVFLGLTMACARCHDHKFDALPTTDYYRMQAFFAGAEFVDRPTAGEQEKSAFEAAKKEIDGRLAPIREKMAALERPYRERLIAEKRSKLTAEELAVLEIPENKRTAIEKKMAAGVNKALAVKWEEVKEAVSADPEVENEREKLKREIYEIEILMPQPPAGAMALAEENASPPETRVFPRGDFKNPAAKVEFRPPGVILAKMGDDAFDAAKAEATEKTSGRRTLLAAWLTRPDHPLTARVVVNRLWQHHFGRGLVASPSDFGVRGVAPSHPELLDWLATELVAEGWSLKAMHRLMVTSATYRQSSDPRRAVEGESREAFERQAEDDPENETVWRMNRRRMEAESLRDAMLAASGELNHAQGGPGVKPAIEKEIEDLIFTEAEVVDLWPENPDPKDHVRRSLYLYRKRNVRYPMFDAFDAPDTQTACAVRDRSTHALQSLVLINGEFAIDRAKALAGRVLRERSEDRARIDRLYRLVLGRGPTEREAGTAVEFLAGQSAELARRCKAGEDVAMPRPECEGVSAAEGGAWVDLCLAMINRNEFVYVP